ncbi:hypothetical protein [Mycobacterium sp. OTB74]|uniref:hypothetical protein n=1 Tax=Mycobacterium sp. OTB74 TaxID=1853452 RepID=UPI002473A21E|nr:hypothetical protein [Mycobacterium sp. OTB74]MDH6243605.1 hypothetical protein [Mycobacterium sp. OTB74]
MLATFGLGRLESMLDTSKDTYTAADVKAFVEKVKAACALTTSDADTLPHRVTSRIDAPRALPTASPLRNNPLGAFSEPELPSPMYAHSGTHSGANPQFRQTRHANRV